MKTKSDPDVTKYLYLLKCSARRIFDMPQIIHVVNIIRQLVPAVVIQDIPAVLTGVVLKPAYAFSFTEIFKPVLPCARLVIAVVIEMASRDRIVVVMFWFNERTGSSDLVNIDAVQAHVSSVDRILHMPQI